VAGVQREWWFHRSGCRAWFLAERDTRTNEVQWTALPADAPAGGDPPTPEASKAPGEGVVT
jgi:sarcosine oxidase delta subunit